MNEANFGARPPASNESSEQESTKLSLEKAYQLLFFSFKFSQGKVPLQKQLFDWLHVAYPKLRFSTPVLKSLPTYATERIQPMLIRGARHQQMTAESVASTVVDWADRMGKRLGTDSEPPAMLRYGANADGSPSFEVVTDPKTLIGAIAMMILNKDASYLDSATGRPGSDPRRDAFTSQFCTYVLKGKPSGSVEFDVLFAQLRQWTRETLQRGTDPRLPAELAFVVRTYNAYHPQLPPIEMDAFVKAHEDHVV